MRYIYIYGVDIKNKLMLSPNTSLDVPDMKKVTCKEIYSNKYWNLGWVHSSIKSRYEFKY